MSRRFARATVVIVLGLLLAACGGSTGSQDSQSKAPINLAFSAATPQVDKVPTIQALEALKKAGHSVKTTYLQQSQDPVQTVVRGDANIGSAAASSVFAAIAQGVPIKAVMEANAPDYELVAPTNVGSPAQLGGLRVGIHAKVSSTALYTDVALEKYPNVKPQILVVPGSANRIQALASGQLDASVVQTSDLPSLNKLAPGKFHVIYDVAKENPNLMDAVIFTRSDLLSSNPTLVKQFISAQLQANQSAYQNPQGLAQEMARVVPKTSLQDATQFSQSYTQDSIWPKDGDMQSSSVNATLKALTASGLLKQAPTQQKCCDLAPLQAVLKSS